MAPPQPEGQETGLQAGTPLLTSLGGPLPGAGTLRVLHGARRQVGCGLQPSCTQRPRRGWQDWVPGALSIASAPRWLTCPHPHSSPAEVRKALEELYECQLSLWAGD